MGCWCRVRVAGLALLCAVIFSSLAVSALAVPPGRVYEMVSPVFKGGFGAPGVEAVGSGGDRAIYYSPGTFLGAPSGVELMDYLANRGPSGWSSAPLMPPITIAVTVTSKDVSSGLGLVLLVGKTGKSSENQDPATEIIEHSTALPDVNNGWNVEGLLEAPNGKLLDALYEGASSEFCRVELSSAESLLPGVSEGVRKLYQLETGCGAVPGGLSLVGVDNAGSPINTGCQVAFGGGAVSAFNAINNTGDTVFFSECGGGTETSGVQLFARLGGARTIEVSRPLEAGRPFGGCVMKGIVGEVPCDGAASRPGAQFVGASEDGSIVYFTTAAPLTGSDHDSGVDLYRATIGCIEGVVEGCSPEEREVTSLMQISRAVQGSSGFQGVVRVAPDGRRVYFVAQGELLSEAERQSLVDEGRPVPELGADDLYVYDENTGSVAFIGELCSGLTKSGFAVDIRCKNEHETDVGLWSSNTGRAQTAGSDGRFLVFDSYAQLTPDDTDSGADVYRYDAETHALVRVSVGEEGFEANGNGSTLGSYIPPGHWGGRLQYRDEMDNRAVSEDGSRIVFTSEEPLSQEAGNGQMNLYEWQEGSVTLLAGGTGEQPIETPVISGDSLNVFFQSSEDLVKQDGDGSPDIYDARIGGGFPEPYAEPQQCDGEGCKESFGALTNVRVPGSRTQTPEASTISAKPVVKKKSETKAKKKNKRKRKSKRKHSVKGRRIRHTAVTHGDRGRLG